MKILMVRHGESMGNVYAREAKAAYKTWTDWNDVPDYKSDISSIGTIRARREYEALLKLPTAVRHQDLPLSDLGIEQSESLKHNSDFLEFARYASTIPDGNLAYGLVISSPYLRATQTAQLSGVHVDDFDERLRDREQGVMDGFTSEGVNHFFPNEWAQRQRNGKFYHRPAGGESWADVVLRVRSFLFEQKMNGTQHLLLFSHDVTILAAIYICNRLREEDILDFQAKTPVANASLTHLTY